MKKQTKSNFVRMVALLPELDVEKQRRILGGTAVAITPPEDGNMIPVTTVAPCLTVESIPMTTTMAPAPTLASPMETSSMPVSTISTPLETMSTPEMVTSPMSVSTTTVSELEKVPQVTDPPAYTWEDMESMLNAGSWRGGMVEGIGYVGEQTTTFSPSNFGTGTYCTYLEYMRSIETNYGEHLVNTATGFVPLLGDFAEYGMGAIRNVLQKLSGDLLDAGYVADSPLYTDIYQNHDNQSFEFRVWDARTGELINSRDVNSLGYYKK
ncbi:MAG: hypothetical protein K2I90_13135 [Odoribacter sp.]|nr:hypothetical protein [Odoribacter sp.]